MKTTKRKLAVQWQAANEKEGTPRIAFGQREVQVKEASGMPDLIALADKSPRHAEMLVELVNAQFHIRFGSQAGKAALQAKAGFGEETTEDQARVFWEDEKVEIVLDYLAAFDEAARRERKAPKSLFDSVYAVWPAEKKAAFDALSDEQKVAKRTAVEEYMKAMEV